MNQQQVISDTETRMEKAVQLLQSQLQGLRTGRATPGLVDSIKVEYYGSQTPLKQMASVTVPEPQQIVIRPYDASAVAAISKAIQASDVGLAPNVDGRIIRLNIPPLSGERRKQLVARVKELSEEARVAIRNVRRDGNKAADQLQKDKQCSEDDCKRLQEKVQDLTKRFENKVNEIAAAKDREVMNE